MKTSKRIVQNIIGTKSRGGKKDWDGDGVINKKDCQPRNTMRQDVMTALPITDGKNVQEKYFANPDFKEDYQENINRFIGKKK